MADYYLEGDPAIDSTRRHLERVLNQPKARRWPWLAAMLAGGAAVTFWRVRHPLRSKDKRASSAQVTAHRIRHMPLVEKLIRK
jgi:hypothetical protein